MILANPHSMYTSYGIWMTLIVGVSFGPIRGAQPAGTTWVNNFDHTPFFDLSQYYIKAFKTGQYPTIEVCSLYLGPCLIY